MAKELTLQQPKGNRGAIELHERAFLARAQIVNGPGARGPIRDNSQSGG
jgi:hypothetical protein